MSPGPTYPLADPGTCGKGADSENQDETDPIETTFELNDTLFAKAEVPPTDEVYIWLGANVMLAYPMDEAETLLVERLAKAKKSLGDCEEDAEFLREQITVSRPSSRPLSSILDPLTVYTHHHARPWRSRQHECTTGMWCKSGRKRTSRKAKKRKKRSPAVAEPAAQGNRESLCREISLPTRHDSPHQKGTDEDRGASNDAQACPTAWETGG